MEKSEVPRNLQSTSVMIISVSLYSLCDRCRVFCEFYLTQKMVSYYYIVIKFSVLCSLLVKKLLCIKS